MENRASLMSRANNNNQIPMYYYYVKQETKVK